MTVRSRALVGIVVAVLAVSACTTSSGKSTQTSSNPTSSAEDSPRDALAPTDPVSWGSGEAVKAVPVDVAHAQSGPAPAIEYTLGTIQQDGSALLPQVLTDRGFVAAKAASAVPEVDYVTAQDVMGIDTKAGFTPFPADPAITGDGPRQAYGASASGDVTAWVETSSADSEIPWRVFANDSAGTHLVSKSEDQGDKSGPLTGMSTAVVDGKVYWATSASSIAKPVNVYSRAADGSGAVNKVFSRAARPVSALGSVVALRTPDEGGPADRGEVLIREGSAERTLMNIWLPSHSLVSAMVGSPTKIAFAVVYTSAPTVIYLADPEAQTAWSITLGADVVPSFALCGDRLVWTSAGTDGTATAPFYALDADSGKVTKVVDVRHAVTGAYCSANQVAWSQLDGDATVTTVATLG